MRPTAYLCALVFAAFSLAGTLARAEHFANSFMEFDLPIGWGCTLEKPTWRCQTNDPGTRGDAVAIIAAKKKGDSDTLASIEAYLAKPRTVRLQSGASTDAHATFVKTTEVFGQPWVDSLWSDVEIPGYYTRYLGTIKDELLVLVSYSVVKQKYEGYNGQLDQLIHSVKLLKIKNEAAQAPRPLPTPATHLAPGIDHGTQSFSHEIVSAPKEAPVQTLPQNTGNGGGGSGLLLLVLLGGGGYFIYKKKKEKEQAGG